MILLDTHAWIWWAANDPQLSRTAARAIGADDVRGVSPLSCYETARLVTRGRLTLDRDVEAWIVAALALPGTAVLDATPTILTRAALLGESLHGDPIDRMLVATAMHHGIPIVTKDRRIRAWDAVRTIW